MYIPNITWAQNQKIIFLNIILEPKENYVINLNNNNIEFIQDNYNFKLILNQEIIVDESSLNKNRIFELNLKKKENNFWNNLLEDSELYKNNIKIDWSRWIDEDDDDDILTSDSDNIEEVDNYVNSDNIDESINNTSTSDE